MTWVFILILLAAIILFLVSSRLQKDSGLPGGRIIRSDVNLWGEHNTQPLFDGSIGLTGKPDYLVRDGNTIIPVELKTGRTPEAPYDAHIFQLAAYLLLTEKVYQLPVPYGLIRYPQNTFQIENTQQLQKQTLDLIAEMHRNETEPNVHRSHADPVRCEHCGYKDICDERL